MSKWEWSSSFRAGAAHMTDMSSQTPNRTHSGVPAGGQFAATNHSEPGLTLDHAQQADLYFIATASDVVPADRANAARDAVNSCPVAFEDLTGGGMQETVEERLTDDVKVIKSVNGLGGLAQEERAYFGKFVADRLYEDSVTEEMDKYFAGWQQNRATAAAPDPELAYELNDPKHPQYLNRIDA